MKIKIFKNTDITIEPYTLTEKNITYLKKNKLENCVEYFKKVYEKNINNVFFYERDDLNKNIKKLMCLVSRNLTVAFIIDKNSNLIIKRFNLYLKDVVTIESFIEEQFGSFFKEIDSNLNNVKSYTEPYKANGDIKNQVISFFVKNQREISKSMNSISFDLGIRYSDIYKHNIKYFTSYIQNKCFSYVDKDLFKELYSYHLHHGNTNLYSILKYHKNNKSIVYNNFIKFKKENNFLSMAYCGETFFKVSNCFKNYDKIIYHTAKILKVEETELKPLIGKNYNDFLYFKTPQKLFNITKKLNFTITDNLTIDKCKFLNSVYQKNKTFINKSEIQRIVDNNDLLNQTVKCMEIRNAFSIVNKYENIDECIKTTNDKITKLLDDYIDYYNQNPIIQLSNYENKEEKFKLTNVNPSFVINSIKSFLLNDNKEFSNLQYWENFINIIELYSSENQYYIFKENRQKHLICLTIKKDFSVAFKKNIVTPRVSKKLEAFLNSDDFILYLSENNASISCLKREYINLNNKYNIKEDLFKEYQDELF